MEEQVLQRRNAGKSFSRIGFAFSLLIVVAFVAQLAFARIPKMLGFGELNKQSWWFWVCASAPMYLFAFPACMLVMKKLPSRTLKKRTLTLQQFLSLIPVCFCLMYGGNLVGTWLSSMLSGGNAVNSLESYAMDNSPLKILVMVILAPLLEELICRKLLIDRTARFGDKISVLMSGLIFGLLHQNLYQFFYAFALGSVFGYVYLRTGRIGYTIILHTLINFLGSVVTPALVTLLNSDEMTALLSGAETGNVSTEAVAEASPALMLMSLYSLAVIVLSVLGLVLLIKKCRKLNWKEPQMPFRTALWVSLFNWGMILYILICLTTTVMALYNIKF